jgi:hypothetical protein
MKQMFAWRGMKSIVHQFVQSYMVCQQAKLDRTKSHGLLQPLPVLDGAWQMITMDFVEGFPWSGNANHIHFVVDKFTKYVHFLPSRHPYTTTVQIEQVNQSLETFLMCFDSACPKKLWS